MELHRARLLVVERASVAVDVELAPGVDVRHAGAGVDCDGPPSLMAVPWVVGRG